eukprot:663876_1
MSKATSTDFVSSPIIYFLAGALLPSLAFLLLRTKPSKQETMLKISGDGFASDGDGDGDDEDDTTTDGEDFESVNKSFSGSDGVVNPKTWGMKDAPYKMILVVNTSLKMGKGKIAAQCCHAAVGCFQRGSKTCPGGVKAWERTGCAKVAVKCPTEEEMDELYAKALSLGIPCYFVEDAGRTQIAPGSRTVLGLGPAPVALFEGITSHLKLM